MTEDEARNKWCPKSNTASWDEGTTGIAAASFNRPFGQLFDATENCNCIASGCACWDWDTEKDYETVQGNIIKAAGHCGLINR